MQSDDLKLYPDCPRPFCASSAQPGGYTCLSILQCATVQRNQMPIVKALYGDDFGEFYTLWQGRKWKARS